MGETSYSLYLIQVLFLIFGFGFWYWNLLEFNRVGAVFEGLAGCLLLGEASHARACHSIGLRPKNRLVGLRPTTLQTGLGLVDRASLFTSKAFGLELISHFFSKFFFEELKTKPETISFPSTLSSEKTKQKTPYSSL